MGGGGRRSNKSIEEILSASKEYISFDDKENELDKKISLVTGCFGTQKWCEVILRDRTKSSKENAMTVCNYLIDYKREKNAPPNTIRTTIQQLSELSRDVGVKKKFTDMTRDDILSSLDGCRKSEDEDPMHKWINTYNTKQQVVTRFFKWLQYPDVGDPKKRAKLSAADKEPKCIQDIPKLKRKEVSSYKPSDMWTPEDDLVFLKYVSNKRDRCYHAMSRDLSARPHEILGLKIKDVQLFKTVNTSTGKRQYTEVLVNGKTGSRSLTLIQSIPYIKDWLDDHPSKNNPDCALFVSQNNQSMGRNKLSVGGLQQAYRHYKKEFFPKLLEDPTISNEDKDAIKALLNKPWNPYVRRHTGATEKSGMLTGSHFTQYGGWTPGSKQPQVYTHYFGSESSKSLLEAYGIEPKDIGGDSVELLSPKICPNCNEGNTYDARFCAKCRLVLTYDAYNEVVEKQQEKELEIQRLQQKYEAVRQEMQKLSSETDQVKIMQEQIAQLQERQSNLIKYLNGNARETRYLHSKYPQIIPREEDLKKWEEEHIGRVSKAELDEYLKEMNKKR